MKIETKIQKLFDKSLGTHWSIIEDKIHRVDITGSSAPTIVEIVTFKAFIDKAVKLTQQDERRKFFNAKNGDTVNAVDIKSGKEIIWKAVKIIEPVDNFYTN